MRVLLALIYNGLLAVKGLLALPLRLIRLRRRPQFVRYSLQGDPPYLYQRRRRHLFRQMRSAGKLVVGYAVHLTNGEYELLCSADRIVLFSSGRLELTGFMAEATALGLALQRAGIAAHFVRRGQYKTAPELFTLPAVSEVQRETARAPS